MHIGLHVKYPLFLSGFNQTWILLTDSKNIQISNFMQIPPVENELFHVDRMKLIIAFRNFAKSAQNAFETRCCVLRHVRFRSIEHRYRGLESHTNCESLWVERLSVWTLPHASSPTYCLNGPDLEKLFSETADTPNRHSINPQPDNEAVTSLTFSNR